MKASVLSVPEPFVGLRPFDKADAHLFFGRDAQVDELLSRLRTQRFVVVMGTSGSGKSSLIRAGLIPALEGGFIASAGSAWRVAVIRPGGNPIGNLSSALIGAYASVIKNDLATHRAILEAVLRRGCFGLVDAVRECPVARTEPLLVVVDQFEELFRFKASADRHAASDHAAAFVKLLLQAARQAEHPIHVVITMRSEFLGDCAEFPELPERINEGLFLIPRLTRDQLAEAIIGPAAVAGARVAPSLVQRLLNDVGDDPDQLPVLQHALMRMWQRLAKEPGKGQLSLEHYGAVKGLDEALSDHADEAFAELDAGQRLIAERIFKCLTERGRGHRDVRRPTRFAELCEIADGSEDAVAVVLEHFRREGRSFIMPAYGQTLLPETFVDLSHESLFRKWERLRLWVAEEAENRKLFVRLSDSAAAHAAGIEPLWRDPQLAIALDWRARFSPTPAWAKRYGRELPPAVAFLDESCEASEQDRRRTLLRRYSWIATAGVLLVAVCGCWWIWDKLRHEREEKHEATVHARFLRDQAELSNTLVRVAEERQVLARQAAEAAARLAAADTAAAAARVREAEQLRQRLIVKVNQRLNPYGSTVGTLVALHAYRRALASGLPDVVSRAHADLGRNLALFQKQLWEARLPQAVTRAGAPAGVPIIVAGTGSSLNVWAVDGSDPREASAPTLPTPVRNLSFSAGGRRVAWISRGTLSVWDAESGEVRTEAGPGSRSVRMIVPAAALPFVFVSGDEVTELRPLAGGESIRLAEGLADRATFSADDSVLAMASDGSLHLWHVTADRGVGREIVHQLSEPSIGALALSPKGTYLAASAAGEILIWRIKSDGQPTGTLEPVAREAVDAPGQRVSEILFSPDEKIVATASSSGRVTILLTAVSAAERTHRKRTLALQSAAEHLAFSRDGHRLAVSGADRSVRVWTGNETGWEWSESGKLFLDGVVQALAFLPASGPEGGLTLLTADASGAVMLWKTTDPANPNGRQASLVDEACRKLRRPLGAEEWETYFGTERYEPPCPGMALDPGELLKLQIIHARDGNASAARDAFRWTRTLGSESPTRLVTVAIAQADAGNRAEARALFRAAVAGASATGRDANEQARINNDVCWQGSIRDFAADVLPACRTAVELADADVSFGYRDSLGVALALSGESAAALSAFEEYVARGQGRRSSRLLARRAQWVADLRRQRNPFRSDKERVLRELRQESPRSADAEFLATPFTRVQHTAAIPSR